MEDGVMTRNGQNVQLNVMEELRPDPEPAATPPLLMEEQIVRERLLKNEIATHKLAVNSIQ